MQPCPELAGFAKRVQLPRTGVGLFVCDSGSPAKPPLLLIHGLGDDADTWRHVFLPLAKDFRVVALDLPGFGRSDKPRRNYSLAFLRDTVLELMETLTLGRTVLVGNSLGAMVSQAVAMQNPKGVVRLVLAGGSLTTRVKSYHPVLLRLTVPILGRNIYDRMRNRPQDAFDGLRLFFANLDGLSEFDRRFLYLRCNERVWDDAQRYAFFSALRQLVWWLPLRRRHFESALARLDVPSHVVWGEMDAVNSLETARELVALQPCAKLTVLKDAGHLPQWEAPEDFLEVVCGLDGA